MTEQRSSRPAPPPRRRRRWLRWTLRALLVVGVVGTLALAAVVGYYYVQLSRVVDDRLAGHRSRTPPRVFARPFELRSGQDLSETELVDRLNDIGYAQRPDPQAPGEFSFANRTARLVAKGGEWHGRGVRVVFTPAKAGATSSDRIDSVSVEGGEAVPSVTLAPPLLTELAGTSREKRRWVGLDSIPDVMREAVLAIEDRRFYEHPGVDVIRTVGAVVTNLKGDKPYLVGGSTLTQQLVKNLMLSREKTIRRKVLEQFMALILERRLTKDEILELYLNEVYLGQRGSFAIHGVAEAARMFFGKDVSNVTLGEAATIAGVIQAPPSYSPFRVPQRARDRRNVVLRAMVESGFISQPEADAAIAEPLTPAPRGIDAEAPFFVDVVAEAFTATYPDLADMTRPVDIYTTLDLHLQRLAQDALREGLAKVDETLARKKRPGRAEGALIAVDPRTGEVLALVGGRAYGQSQFNRAVSARRQPGSIFKPFVYLAAFETATAEGRTDLTPATLVDDTPTTFLFGEEQWAPANYGDEYDGIITLRRALAMSRNVATARVAELVGFGQVAALWRRAGTSMHPRAYPSIALGVFEVTPWEMAEAYTLFENGGEIRPLTTVVRVSSESRDATPAVRKPSRRVAGPHATFLVTNMMRSVVNEGTGAGARAAGFALDAAGKTGTTNDLRDAWFVGFTPELLTAVWVGFDDNREVGLSGSQAALPIWTSFMMRALAGHANKTFDPPEGVTFVEIDRDTGRLASPGCFRTISEAFVSGTEPTEYCEVHRF